MDGPEGRGSEGVLPEGVLLRGGGLEAETVGGGLESEGVRGGVGEDLGVVDAEGGLGGAVGTGAEF